MSKLALPIAVAVAVGLLIALAIVFWDSPDEPRPALPESGSASSSSSAGEAAPTSTATDSSPTGSSMARAAPAGTDTAAAPTTEPFNPTGLAAGTPAPPAAATEAAATSATTQLPDVRKIDVPPVSDARVPENPLRPDLSGRNSDPRDGAIARELIAAIRAGKTPFNPENLMRRANELRQQNKHVDAHLLDFFSAREGYGPAAYNLARAYDPMSTRQTGNIMDEPDAYQAFKWYQKAREAGVADASSQLDALHGWVKEAADNGNAELQMLLKQWK